MKRAWTHLTLLVALVILPAAPAGGRQKPPAGRPAGAADPLRVVLEKNGYVAVPLAQEERDNCFTVVCKSGTETWRMLLDTGAEDSSLDTGLVKKLGLKHGDEVKVIGIEGVRTGVEVSLRGLSIGDLDSRAAAGSFSLQAFDFTGTNATRGQRKLRRIDGLLGRSVLRLYSAVIDYPTRTLYLRTPLEGLRPEIEGRWVATRVEADGRERQPGPKGPPRLEFKDRRFHLTDGANEYIFGLHVRPEKDRYAVSFFDPEQEFATEVTYRAGGLLKVSGDKLTVCLALDPAARGKLPDDFAARPGAAVSSWSSGASGRRTDRPPARCGPCSKRKGTSPSRSPRRTETIVPASRARAGPNRFG